MRPPYTRELLTEVAAESSTLSEMLLRLGRNPRSGCYSHLKRRLAEYDIDTSHFTRSRVYTRDVLVEAVAASTSIAGVIRHLGQRQAGGTHAHISRRIKHFGIDTSHFTRSAPAARKGGRRNPEELLVQMPPQRRRVPGQRLRRALIDTGRPDVCELCGTGPVWLGHPLTLEVDHINGDWSDNRRDNLRLLCPNCHATTDTYCGRNKNRSSASAPPSQAATHHTKAVM